MHRIVFFKNLFAVSFLFVGYCFAENETLSTTLGATTTANLSTIKPCPGGQIDAPNCTKCLMNFEQKNNQCFEIKNNVEPTHRTGRTILLIFLACLLTIVLLVTMLIVYTRLNHQHHRHISSNPSDSSENTNNRFNNLLRAIGLNKRGRFNFFSISNNNSSLGQYRQPDASNAYLSENPDEALLFDDPYADGGFQNSASNPYRSLTLAVT
ncbi:unnamed protein product [Adineta ricciae]|uniref:Uncharacterized protein n=1 Tax=Adineta ricciae TaxID=249248 RepID=A0A815TW10_ADIRI|nr:unnamed protein product [Adineta ricciae]CAF1509376.1 unnamed protein product [Adineta ricciae]